MKTHGLVVRSNGGRLTISCQCRASETKHTRDKGGGEYYEPFPPASHLTIWDRYNDPENHLVEFTEEDRIIT